MSQEFIDLPEANIQVQEKIDKAPFVHVVYTPSKLKENVLYTEVATMKKDQEKNSKIREIRAQNDLLQDKLTQYKREKQGIQSSLNQQIVMYKKFLDEMEGKYELKIRDLQTEFHEQMQIVIKDEEDKAKIVQAQKQKYEEDISLLKKKNEILEQKLSEALLKIQILTSEKQNIHVSQKSINLELEQLRELKKAEEKRKKQEYDELKRQFYESQEAWKMNLHTSMLQKDKQLESIKRQSLLDLSKLQQQAASENELKNSQIQEITKTFNAEVERLTGQLADRENAIQGLKQQLSEQKEKTLQATRAFDKEVNSLIYEKGRVASELEVAKSANLKLMERERALALHPIGLNIEIDKLRQLLLESSTQLEKCKEELVFLDKERSRLLYELGRSNRDNLYLQWSRRDSVYRM